MKRLLPFALALALAFAPCAPAAAENHALILTVGKYRAGIPQLHGVQFDADSARRIARAMGVPEGNITHLADDQLDLTGMRQAFAALEERVQPGDDVFVYYSGHGGRQLVPGPQERCAESLITVKGEGFPDYELEDQLRRLGAKADKVVVLLDACHSGGVTTRALGDKSPEFAPKYAARGGEDSCARPVNILTRGLAVQSRSLGSGANNFVYIAAARDNEVSLDQPKKGGVATQAWRDCITGGAVDKDRSGGLTAEEIRACAQERINKTLAHVQGFLPHNVTITGNGQAVLAFADKAAAEPAPPPAAAAFPPAYYTLSDVYNRRDDRRLVTLTPARPAFRIGADAVQFTLHSTHAGYVYILMVGSDGKTFDMIFPNQLDGANQISAGQTLLLPRPSWEITAGGPAGKNHLLAIVSEAPRDFAAIGMQAAGPFSMVGASPAASKDIQLVTGTSAAAATPECRENRATRTLKIKQRCSNAYGAAMAVIEEVQ